MASLSSWPHFFTLHEVHPGNATYQEEWRDAGWAGTGGDGEKEEI